MTQLPDQFEITHIPAAAGVRHGDRAPLSQPPDEIGVDAPLQALVVGRVDQELGAVRLEFAYGIWSRPWLLWWERDATMPGPQRRRIACVRTLIDLHVGHGLPFVHGDPPGAIVPPPTAQVDDELALVAVQGSQDGVESLLAEAAFGEEVGCDDDLLNSGNPSAWIRYSPSPSPSPGRRERPSRSQPFQRRPRSTPWRSGRRCPRRSAAGRATRRGPRARRRGCPGRA